MTKMLKMINMSEEITTPSPPPLKYAKVPVSRISMGRRNSFEMKVLTSSPNTSSPIGRNSSLPLPLGSKSSPNQSFCRVTKLFAKKSRRSISRVEDSNCSISRETPKSVNINPFTTTAMLETIRKQQHSQAKRCSTPSINNVRRLESFFESESEGEEVEQPEQPIPTPMKSVRVADFTVSNSRYEEFLEIAEIASGEFGIVKCARHRLDGNLYAIKISKKNLEASRKMALKEVFAHAALNKHKHVVRYYNSWVERGRVYIQNEFCHGGSLGQKIKEFKRSGASFSETELNKMLVQILKGLQYIHNKQLVHLDIKPDNIFISTDQDGPAPNPGASIVDRLHVSANSSSDKVNTVDYKIGDLGHVAHIYAEDISPEEGDCRYMAPEFLQMYVDPHKLSKADIFSLGLTIYEAASLTPLPKNSNDDPNYENIRKGNLPFLHIYSRRFNSLILSMVNKDPSLRPNTTQLLADSHPKCNVLQELDDKDIPFYIHTFGHTEIEAKTVVGETLDEVDPPSEGEKTKVNLIIAQDRIINLEKEILSKDLKISKLNDTFKSVDILNEFSLSKDKKLENYEILLKKIHAELQSLQRK